MVYQIVLVCFAVLLLSTYTIQSNHNEGWWKHALFYQIYPRSFKDSNNDGIGDFKGISSKLEYLKDTRIDAFLLSPIYPSPGVDAGYDVSDFTSVNPEFGTMENFEELLARSHKLGLKIIIDFVPNHSSNEHEWFKKSESRISGYENYYVWLDGKDNNSKPPNNWISRFHGSAWEYSKKRGQWYLHQYAKEQPDLNYRCPEVVNEMKKVLKFWLDKGVDGFRVDAVTKLFEKDGYPDEPLSNNPKYTENDHGYLIHKYTVEQPETLDMVYQWRMFLDNYTASYGGGERIMITEAHSDLSNVFNYYGNETYNGAHFSFNFFLMSDIRRSSNASDVKSAIDKWWNNIPKRYTSNWVIGNHDQHRVASRLGVEWVDGMIMMQMFLPGVAITYQGEEIGMEDGDITWEDANDPRAYNGNPEDLQRNSRDYERTPYQWNGEVNAGFNQGAKPWLPVGAKYRETNLAAQIASDRSHYKVYRKLLELRKKDVFKSGEFTSTALSESVLLLTRKLSFEETYLLVVNLRDEEELLSIPADIFLEYELVLTNVNSSRKPGDIIPVEQLRLEPFESLIIRPKCDSSFSTDDLYFIIFTTAFFSIVLFIAYATFFYTKNYEHYEYTKLATIQETSRFREELA